MKRFNKIAIIGVGLIGGSVGLAIKKKRLAGEVIGVFRHSSTMKKALKRKAIDKGVMNIKAGVEDADLIILATPVFTIKKVAEETVKYAKVGAIITDVGSTKQWIVDKAEKLLARRLRCRGFARRLRRRGFARRPTLFFVGSHPMAGSDKTSVEFARADLMEGAPCIVTRTAKTDKKALAKVSDFWKALGARVTVMSPAQHDWSICLVSHLPHLVAFSLVGAVPEGKLSYAAEGFKDTTRVASSDPYLWADIFLTNRKEMVKAGRLFGKYYKNLIKAIAKGDYAKVASSLGQAKRKRDKFRYTQMGTD